MNCKDGVARGWLANGFGKVVWKMVVFMRMVGKGLEVGGLQKGGVYEVGLRK